MSKPAWVCCQNLGHRRFPVDERCAELLDDGSATRRVARAHLGPEGAGELHRDMADAAGTALDEDLHPGSDAGSVDEALPGRDEDERQRGRLAHGEAGRLPGHQGGVHRGVFGQ